MQSQILPSREALAKRIALQFSYGQNLIHLVASSGCGKSYLLEHFITDHYENFNKAYVQANASSKDEDVQTYLLEHSFAYPLVDVSEPLRDNFLRLLKEQGDRQLLWVIDNAKQLSEELIAELEWLAQNAPCQLYILCASSQSGLFAGAIDIHLEPLTPAESLKLLGYFYRQLPAVEDPVFAEFMRECQGNPSLLLQWQQTEQQMPRAQRRKFNSNWLYGLGVLAVVLVFGAIYQFQQPPQSELLSDTKVKPALVEVSATEQQGNDEEIESPKTSTELESPVEISSSEYVAQQHLQPKTPDLPGFGDELSDASVAEILTELSQPKSARASAQVTSETASELARTQDYTQQDTKQAQREANEGEDEPSVTPPDTATSAAPYDHQWFLAQDDDVWVWQLTIMSTEQQVDQYRRRYSLAQTTKHYLRADKGWHVITWSQTGTRTAIEQYKADIESKILNIEPYAKQIRQIKAEINSQPATQMR